MPGKKQIRTLEGLEEEIGRLRRRSVRLQRTMDENMQYLKENAGAMAWRTMLSGKLMDKHPVTGLLFSSILRHEKVQGFIQRFLGKVIDGVENAFSKGKDTKDPDEAI